MDDNTNTQFSNTNNSPSIVFDWYHASRSDVEIRIWQVARFADWLSNVNSEFDQALPECFLQHPWIIMLVDALYVRYYDSYVSQDAPNDSVPYFIDLVYTTISRLNAWRQATEHNSTCSGVQTSVSIQRANRIKNEVSKGYHVEHYYEFPFDDVAKNVHSHANSQYASMDQASKE
jgi:hypothetical protein